MFWEETLGLKSLLSFLSNFTNFMSFPSCSSALFGFSFSISGQFLSPCWILSLLSPPGQGYSMRFCLQASAVLSPLFFGDPMDTHGFSCLNDALVSGWCYSHASFPWSQHHTLESELTIVPPTWLFLLVSLFVNVMTFQDNDAQNPNIIGLWTHYFP